MWHSASAYECCLYDVRQGKISMSTTELNRQPLDQMHLPPPPGQVPEEEEGMTLMEHLIELRTRLVKAGIAVILGMGVGAFLVMGPPKLVTYIVVTLTGNDGTGRASPTQAVTSTEAFTSYMTVALTVGVILAMPVIVYQLIAFIAPGLTDSEKRYLFIAIPFVTVFFIAGITFGWFITVPAALQFLLTFGDTNITLIQPSLSDFISTVTTLLLINGVVFEMPIVIYVLAALGLVSAKTLASYRRYAMVVIVILAAIITPTGDPINLMLLAIPMYLLFELGIVLARLAPRRKVA